LERSLRCLLSVTLVEAVLLGARRGSAYPTVMDVGRHAALVAPDGGISSRRPRIPANAMTADAFWDSSGSTRASLRALVTGTGTGTGTEPRKLSCCWRHKVRVGALYLSRSASSSSVSTAILCSRVPGCWVAVGCGPRGAAGGVSGRLSRMGFRGQGRSRSPRRGRRLSVGCWRARRGCPHPTVAVRGKAISDTRWPSHRRRNRRVGKQAVFAVATGRLRVSLTGRDISVDPLATHLIINRRFPHAATP
jgi:hypothetical protein